MTNRKRFDNLSNAELAKILVKEEWCDGCEGCALKICSTEECVELVRMWLEGKCKDNPPADNEPQETIPLEVSVDLRKVAKEIIKECKGYYPNHCKGCRYGDIVGLCCFKDRPTTWGVEIADKGTQHNNVNHPDHYNHGKIEVVDFIEDQHLGFHLGNAVKYISRAGRKDPARTVEDLRKAAWYLNRQIERLEMSLGGQNA